MLLLRARVDLGVMAIKGYSAFPQDPLLPSDCLESYTGHSLRKSSPEEPTVVNAVAARVIRATRAGRGTQRSPGHPLQPGSLSS